MQQGEVDGDVSSFTSRRARKVAQVTANPRANVVTAGSGSWVSLAPTWCCQGSTTAGSTRLSGCDRRRRPDYARTALGESSSAAGRHRSAGSGRANRYP